MDLTSDGDDENSPFGTRAIKEVFDSCDEMKMNAINSMLSSKENNSLKTAFMNGVISDIRKKINSKTFDARVTISETLTTEEQNLLTDAFPEFDLRFTDNVVNSHGYAAASRKLERKVLLKKIGVDFGNVYDNIVVKEVGGDIVNSLLSGEQKVHCCSPLLSVYDGNRLTNRLNRASSHLKKKVFDTAYQRDTLDRFVQKAGSLQSDTYFCFSKSQNCNVTSDYLLCLHSTYDMKPKDLADSMDIANARTTYGCFLYTSQILTDDKGEMPTIRADYTIDRDFFGNRRHINFGFEGCDGFCYDHNYNDYVKWLTMSQVYSSGGRLYSLELLENRNGVQFFVMQRIFHVDGPATTHRLYLNHLKDHYVIRYPYLHYSDPHKWSNYLRRKNNYSGNSEDFWSDLPGNKQWIYFKVHEYVFHRTCAYVLGNTEEKFKPENIITFLRSIYSREIKLSAVLPKNDIPEAIYLSALAHVMYIFLYNIKYVFGKTLQQALIEVNKLRGTSSDKDVLREFRKRKGFWSSCFGGCLSNLDNNGFDPNFFILKPSDYVEFRSKNGRTRVINERECSVVLPNLVDDLVLHKVVEEGLPTPVHEVKSVNTTPHHKQKSCPAVVKYCKKSKKMFDKAVYVVSSAFVKKKKKKPFIDVEKINGGVTDDVTAGSIVVDGPAVESTTVDNNLTTDLINKELNPKIIEEEVEECEDSYHDAEGDEIMIVDVADTVEVNLISPSCDELGDCCDYFDSDEGDNIESDLDDHTDYYSSLEVLQVETEIESAKLEALDKSRFVTIKKNCKKPLPEDVINRSQAKLREIIGMCRFDYSAVLDLCSAPGGFVLELLKKSSNVDYVPYSGGNIVVSELVKSSNANKVAITAVNDITEPNFVAKFKEFGRRYSLVTADGALESDSNRIEENNLGLISAEIRCALSCLETGGSFLLKVFNLFNRRSLHLVLQTARNFDSFQLIRCDYTTRISSEFYVVFVGRLAMPRQCLSVDCVEKFFDFLIAQHKLKLVLYRELLASIANSSGNTYPGLGLYSDGRINVDGSRNDCLILAALEDRNIDPLVVRKEMAENAGENLELREEAVPWVMCGRATLEFLSRKYNVNFFIRTEMGNELMKINETPTRVVQLLLKNRHYYIVTKCDRREEIQHRRLEMYDRIDYLALYTNIYKKLFPGLINLTDLSPDKKLNGRFMYNNLSKVCTLHNYCVNNNFERVVDFVKSCYYDISVLVLIEVKNIDYERFFETVHKYTEIGFKLVDYQIMGYILVMIDRSGNGLKKASKGDIQHFLEHKCTTKRNPFKSYDRGASILYTCGKEVVDQQDNNDYDLHILIDSFVSGDYLIRKTRNELVINGKTDNSICDQKALGVIYSEIDKCIKGRSKLLSVLLESRYSNLNHIINYLTAKVELLDIRIADNKLFTDDTDVIPFLVNTSKRNNLINSMLEQLYLWNQQRITITQKMEGSHSSCLITPDVDVVDRTIDVSLVVYDLKKNKYIYGIDVDPPYQWGFNGKELISTSDMFDKGKVNREFVNALIDKGITKLMFSSATKLVHGIALSKKFDRSLALSFEPPEMKYIQGVPGAGKTYHILKNNEGKTKNLIVTVTREAKDDILARKKANKLIVLEDRRVRTVDSLLINGFKGEVEELWLDEAFLVHAGSWMWLAQVTKCRRLIVVGDSAQIPYINRDGLKTEYSKWNNCDAEKQVLSVNRRNPLDIVCWLECSKFYDFRVTGISEIVKSVSWQKIGSISAVPKLVDRKYLTFTQADKQDCISQHFPNVSTIHEYQGNQSDHVVLVRNTLKKADTIFESEPHILVALTRHRKSFTYYTVTDDKMSGIVDTIKHLPKAKILSVRSCLEAGSDLTVVKERCEKSVVLHTVNRKHREIISRIGESGYVSSSYEINYHFNEAREADPHDFSAEGLNAIQTFVDGLTAGSGTEFQEFDHYMFEHQHLETDSVDALSMSLPNQKKYDFLTPVILTSIQYPLHSSQKLSMKAFFERNGNVPQLQGCVDEYRQANIMFDKFKLLLKNQAAYNEKPIVPNVESIDSWLSKQPPSVVTQIMSEEYIQDQRFDIYEFILKNLAKIDLDLDAEFRYKSPQTIAFQKKTLNAAFCPILKDMMDRVIVELDDSIMLYNSMSPEEYAQLLTRRFSEDKQSRLNKFLEIDFSKYDKSQGLVILMFECLLMQHFGVPDRYVRAWIVMHRVTAIIDYNNKFSATVHYQRKSGDAGTWRLNTLVQLAVLNEVYDLHKKVKLESVVMLLSGDDSVIFLDEYPDDCEERTKFLQYRYNLEAKLMKYNLPYFCSKFLIYAEHQWLFVPDTLKLCVKLGRHDMVDYEHVECYRISFADNLYYYKFKQFWPYISMCINDRYKTSGDHDYVFKALLNLSLSSEKFKELYKRKSTYRRGWFNRSNRPSVEI